MEWLDAKPVPPGNNNVPALVVQDEGEFASDVLNKVGSSVDLVQGDQHLAVAVALEVISMLVGQDLAEPVKVIHFPVDHCVYCPIVAMDGLVGVDRQIVDRQTRMAEACICGWLEVGSSCEEM